MGIETVWNIDLKHYNQDINWKKVWNNIRFTSSNYNNQTVNYKLIHRYYLSPRKCCQLKIIASPICALCTLNVVGTYVHMFWECPTVLTFWKQITTKISNIVEVQIPCLPNVVLLNDDCALELNRHKRLIVFSGLTAAKKMLVMRWKPPHSLNIRQWLCSFMEILSLELSIARTRNISNEFIEQLIEAIGKIRSSL